MIDARRAQLLASLKRLRAKVASGSVVPVFMLLFGIGDPLAYEIAELLEQQATPCRWRAARAFARWLETRDPADERAVLEADRAAAAEVDLWTWVERQPHGEVLRLIDRTILKGAANA
jgi:hypothetical protein